MGTIAETYVSNSISMDFTHPDLTKAKAMVEQNSMCQSVRVMG